MRMNMIERSLAVRMVAGVVALVAVSQRPASAEATFSCVTVGNPGNAADRTGVDADAVPEGLAGSDWKSIRQAYERHRHAAVAVDGGFRARNPGQQWLTRFDGRGFTVQPNIAGWRWGLELQSYGFPGHPRAVSGQARMTAQDDRVTYDWDAGLREWFVNGRGGLEHGFTLASRPPGASDPQPGAGDPRPGAYGWLELRLAVRGGLRAQGHADGRGVSFVNEQGHTVVNYTGLKVWDADNRELPARIDADAAGLRLTMDERRARYPLTIDPIAQQAYLKASNTDTRDEFGYSVGVSGDTVVVGAWMEDSSATGVNGNQADDSASEAGAAYVFVRDSGGVWHQQAYLKASNTDSNDRFGGAVGVSGDTVVVGAIFEKSSATGVNGDEGDNRPFDSGAAYVFVRDSAGTWSQQAYLKASNTGASDAFGVSVGVSGDTVVVGSSLEDSNATGVNGNEADNSARDSGAAYVFVRDTGGVWTQQAYLKASNTDRRDVFGTSVGVSGDTVVVGARWEDSNATGVNGNQADNGAGDSGAAYVFVRDGASSWSQQAYLKASNTDSSDRFSISVAVSGDTVVVGALGEESNATGVNGDEGDNSASQSGAAYVFVREPGGLWSQQAYLKASNTGEGDWFGRRVGVSGDTVVVGAPSEDSSAAGIDGDEGDNSVFGSGAAYVFVRDGAGSWSQRVYLKASNTGTFDLFGLSVAVSGDTVVAGAQREDSRAKGVDGNQADNSRPHAGAAYVFLVLQDCNENGINDRDDIAQGTSEDCNNNGVPDECEQELDSDGDGILDSCDACQDSDMSNTIVIGSCNSGVSNDLFDDGCTMVDMLKDCGQKARNHSSFVRCIATLSSFWKRQGLISGKDVGRIVNCAGSSVRDSSIERIHPGTRRRE